MGLTLITPASVPAVSLVDIKAITGIEDSGFDAQLTLLSAAAHRKIGQMLGLSLGEETWQLTLDAFSDAIELPRGQVTAVTAFKYSDTAGAEQTVSPSLYSLDLISTPQWIVRIADAVWPDVLDGVNAVRITFTAGLVAATIPGDLKLAVAGLVKHWFEAGPAAAVPAGLDDLLAPYRQLWICA